MKHRLLLVIWLTLLSPGGMTSADAGQMQASANPISRLTRMAQAQPAPAPNAAPADAQPASDEPIGNVATLTGSATVTRNNTWQRR